MLLEIHSHTKEHSPCSHVRAVDLVREVRDKGLQGIVLTDHHYVWSAKALTALKRKAQLEDFFVLLSAQEVTTDKGDVLVFGPVEPIPRHTPLETIVSSFPDACVVWAHPYRGGARPAPELLNQNPFLHGIEIFSSNHTVRDNVQGLQDWHRYKFTALAGTDAHASGYAGTYPTQFDHGIQTMDDLVNEIRCGRCRPFFKEIPHTGANIQVTEIVVGTKGKNEIRERWIVKKIPKPSKWEKMGRTFRIMETFYNRGFDNGPFRVPEPLDMDPDTHTLIEVGQRGKSLYEKLNQVPSREGRRLMDMVAHWLATFHDSNVEISSPESFLESEERRIQAYMKRFIQTGNPHYKRASVLAETILAAEETMAQTMADFFVPGHGDFHPKNVVVGQDRADDASSLFISVIDFDNARSYPRAYDLGTFLAQFNSQFSPCPEILKRYKEEAFLEAYRRYAVSAPEDLLQRVELFKARANLSIAAYLIKVGKGDSPELWSLLVEAEASVSMCCS